MQLQARKISSNMRSKTISRRQHPHEKIEIKIPYWDAQELHTHATRTQNMIQFSKRKRKKQTRQDKIGPRFQEKKIHNKKWQKGGGAYALLSDGHIWPFGGGGLRAIWQFAGLIPRRAQEKPRETRGEKSMTKIVKK